MRIFGHNINHIFLREMNKESILNFVYSIGAAIVILGAFFKMTHTTLGGLVNPIFVLGTGLIVECVIFVIYAFNPPKEEKNYAWENVYPELLDANAQPKPRKNVVSQVAETKEMEASLSSKLDKMLAEAKIDATLFESLRGGIEKISTSVEQINKTVDVLNATSKYNEELNKATTNMESLNALYTLQLENLKNSSDYQSKYVADLQKSAQYSEKFNEELQGLTSNISNLNKVYGGMLNAMKS